MAQIQLIRCGSVNCYLIIQGRDAVLADTGRSAHLQRVLEACRPWRVRLLALTHGHMDHAENAAALAEALGVPIAMSGADLPLLADNWAQPLVPAGLRGRLLLAASRRMLRSGGLPPFSPSVLLEDGDSLERWGIPARVIGLPGHTAGSIGFDVEGRWLLAGDALMHLGPPGPALICRDRDQALQSAARIAGLGARRIYFGHGRPADNRNWGGGAV